MNLVNVYHSISLSPSPLHQPKRGPLACTLMCPRGCSTGVLSLQSKSPNTGSMAPPPMPAGGAWRLGGSPPASFCGWGGCCCCCVGRWQLMGGPHSSASSPGGVPHTATWDNNTHHAHHSYFIWLISCVVVHMSWYQVTNNGILFRKSYGNVLLHELWDRDATSTKQTTSFWVTWSPLPK